MRLFDHGAADDRPVLEHILQIYQIAVMHVLGEVVRVVEMDDALFVRLHDIRRQEQTHGDVLGYLARHVVALNRVDGGVLVGIFLLDLFVIALNQGQNLIVGGVGGTCKVARVAVTDIPLCRFIRAVTHDAGLHQLLNFLHGEGAVHCPCVLLYLLGNFGYICIGQLPRARGRLIRLLYGAYDLIDAEILFHTAALDNLQLDFLLKQTCLRM